MSNIEQSNSSTMNQSDLDSLSLRRLAEQFPANLIMTIGCVFFFATNTFVIATIYRTKSLHTKSLWLVCSLSFVDILVSFALFPPYLRRVILYFAQMPETTTQFVCFCMQIPGSYTNSLEQLMILALAIDRFVCIKFPIFYKTVRTMPYVLTFNCTCMGLEAFMSIYGYVTLDQHLAMVPVCDRTTSYGPTFLAVQNMKSLTSYILIIVTYLVLAAIMYRRYKSAKINAETQKSGQRRQLDFDVFFATVLIDGISIVVYGTLVLAMLFDSHTDRVSVAMILATTSVLLHSVSYFFVYFKVNKQFRQAFFVVVCRRAKIEQTLVKMIGQGAGVDASSTV